MATAIPYIMLATSVASIGLQVQAGQEQQKAMLQQSELRKQQAKQSELQAKQNAIAVMDNISATNATIMARAGAGGIDAMSGTPAQLQRLATAAGLTEYATVSNNATIAARVGLLDSQQMVSQGRSALYSGLAGATTSALNAAKVYKAEFS